MNDETDDVDPEWVKRAGQKAVRIAHLHFGWVPITEYTQEDFDHQMKAAMWRCEPEDEDD